MLVFVLMLTLILKRNADTKCNDYDLQDTIIRFYCHFSDVLLQKTKQIRYYSAKRMIKIKSFITQNVTK